MKPIKDYLNEVQLNEKSVDITSTNNGHYHEYQINEDGIGITISTMSKDNRAVVHDHEIVNYKVAKVNNHTHTIKDK